MIDQILEQSEQSKNGIIELSELKNDIPGVRLKNVNFALDKIALLKKITLPKSIVDLVDRKLLLKYYDRIMVLSPSNILEFSPVAKYATMAIFCYIRLQLILDSLADTLIKLIKRIRSSSEKYVDNYIVKEVKRVDGKFDILEKLASLSVNNPKSTIEDKIYPEVSKEKLEAIITDLQQRGKWYQQQVQNKIHSKYAYGSRTTLLPILQTFQLKEDHSSYQPILKAVEFINKYWNESDSEYYETEPPIEGIIPTNWHPMVVQVDKDVIKVNKYNYELAVLEELKRFLNFKAIWIKRSYRYRNPEEDIPKDFEQKKQQYYQELGLPLDDKEFITKLQNALERGLENLNSKIPNNNLVKIKTSTVGKNITITPSEAQKDPNNIIALQKEITGRWSSINLIDILKETDLLTNFTRQMETIAKSSSIEPSGLRKRLLLCLYGIGSNTGLKRISIANGDVNYSDLRYIKKRYINATNVRNSIRLIINNILKIRNPDIWGEATTSVACDSTKISSWDQNLINEWHHRYQGRGVMIYWHVDKKSLCIYSQLKSCSSSEVGSMIKGIIDHDTEMNMNRVFVDTHGQSVIGFAISYLLDFDLLPRLKAINKQKLYGVASGDKWKYQYISEIIKGGINWKLIEENYNEAVKHLVALKLGIVEPDVLVKRFSNNNYEHPVYRTLLEIGKANKSIFLCKYLDSEDLRIEINEGLNVVERLNYIMDFIFYGKLGELTTNNIGDQELSILCLHLLQACIVYINTLIIQQVLSEPHWQNKLTPEDYRALTPLLSTHINPYGLFPIDFNQRILIYSQAGSGYYR
ncbi:Tn3 family transposase [Rickettsia endosymbiont of Polydrusus tereticollis]|uniref:Tn3 family transposase n=1 Tax=Rickettsia endosymbiont of Polydrusus tereticollis TaxID=3066251 RepID=UPI003132E01A